MITPETVIFIIFLIFTGAALLATVAVFTRQSLLVAYILIGCILGPFGLGWVPNGQALKGAGDIGMLFLLFLLGLELKPQKFLHALQKTAPATLFSSVLFMALGYAVSLLFHYSSTEACIVGLSMMFSSTIVGLKLLPTTILHHRKTGEIMISILLSQDMIAVLILVWLGGVSHHGVSWIDFLGLGISFPLLLGTAFLIERFIVTPCFKRFDTLHEYVLLLAIGWCLSIAELAHWMGFSTEIGAFIAGVMLAASPIAAYLAESLKPLRDFFLVMFFFSIGAEFDFHYGYEILWPALLLTAAVLIFKPILFGQLLEKTCQSKTVAFEVGVRLGQGSEFALLLTNLALQAAMIELQTAYLVQATVILSFIVSSYWVVLRYPTPLKQ